MKLSEARKKSRSSALATISLADTVGAADTNLITDLLDSILPRLDGIEVGMHLHSTRVEAAGKVLAAYDAGCRRFDSALGGLGGCPFAQDELVGNVPTEELLQALEARGVESPVKTAVAAVASLNNEIARGFSG